MPNGNVHNIAGGFCGVITYLIIQNNSDLKEVFKIDEAILSFCTGVGTARIPDILEPATNPNHRSFFHSLVFGGALSFVGVQAWKDLQRKRNERKLLGINKISSSEIMDIVFLVAVCSIGLHLIMDGFTKKGLPLI